MPPCLFIHFDGYYRTFSLLDY